MHARLMLACLLGDRLPVKYSLACSMPALLLNLSAPKQMMKNSCKLNDPDIKCVTIRNHGQLGVTPSQIQSNPSPPPNYADKVTFPFQHKIKGTPWHPNYSISGIRSHFHLFLYNILMITVRNYSYNCKCTVQME